MLSSQASAEPGRWRTARAEYQRGIMDAANDPTIDTIVWMSSAQVGKTEVLNNILGYHIHHDPAPILVVQPQEPMAKAWSVDRLAPMLRDTPVLRDLTVESKSKEHKDTILHKVFPGGHCTVAGSTSGANLASRPIRILLCDEVDRYPPSAGDEGDPVDLATKRSTTFWNKKRILTSTPTVRGASRIEDAYESGDQRRFFVPCPDCGEFQIMTWENVHIPRTPEGEKEPDLSTYQCGACQSHWDDVKRWRAVSQGEWKATADEWTPGVASFHLNELYSPWVELRDMVQRWIGAQTSTQKLQVFVNTALGETWEIEGVQVSDMELMERREDYGPEVPGKAVVLTAGVDVQEDRLECEVVAWSPILQSWSMDYRIFWGDTNADAVYAELEQYLKSTRWEHECGVKLSVKAMCIDSGYNTQRVYRFCVGKQQWNWFATKGVGSHGTPALGSMSRRNKLNVPVYTVGTNDAKTTLFGRLRQEDRESHGYMHLPLDREEEWFKQLTAEKAVKKQKGGAAYYEFVQTRKRNEALDIRILATVALEILNPPLEIFAKELAAYTPPLPNEPRVPSLGGRTATKMTSEPKGHMW